MAVTPHTNDIDEIFAIGAGNQTWKALLAAVYPGMNLSHRHFNFTVISGAPIAMAKKTMAAITDGAQYGIGEGDAEYANPPGVIDGSRINFYGSGVGSIRVQASNR